MYEKLLDFGNATSVRLILATNSSATLTSHFPRCMQVLTLGTCDKTKPGYNELNKSFRKGSNTLHFPIVSVQELGMDSALCLRSCLVGQNDVRCESDQLFLP